jgi:hypothetical protein
MLDIKKQIRDLDGVLNEEEQKQANLLIKQTAELDAQKRLKEDELKQINALAERMGGDENSREETLRLAGQEFSQVGGERFASEA